MLEETWRTAEKVLVDHTEIFSRKISKCSCVLKSSCPLRWKAGGHRQGWHSLGTAVLPEGTLGDPFSSWSPVPLQCFTGVTPQQGCEN